MIKISRPLTRIQADLLLLLTSFVWGSGFIAQRVAAPHLSIYFYNGGRFLLGALLILPLIKFRLTIHKKDALGVLAAGLLLFSAGALQQAGMRTTTAANAGFITGLYVIFVPFFLLLFWKQRQTWNVWLAAVVAVIGMLLLSNGGELKMAIGDLLELAGAVLWALHVIVVGRAVQHTPALHFAVGQFLVCAFFSLLTGFLLEPAAIQQVPQLWWTIVYNGIASVAIGFTLQAVGQKYAPPTDAALILSMESVFAAVLGYLFLREILTPLQLLGSFLVMAAIILAQLRVKRVKSI